MSEFLSKIYKRASSGKIQEWTIEIDGDKFRTIAGQTTGKKTVSKWTNCKGKNTGKANATTPEEQAKKEALAKRTLKLEGEYFATIEEIDNGTKFKSPMLADEYEEYLEKHIIEFPAYGQPKLDGIRCIATAQGLFTREGNILVSVPHINEALAPIFLKYPELELDGELYSHELKDDFDKLVTLIKRPKPTAEDIAASVVIEYWVYDIRDETKVFSERSNRVFELLKELSNKSLVAVETVKLDNDKELEAYYQLVLAFKFEGVMIRQNSEYVFDRTTDLLKRKPWITEEFEILEVLEGKGNRAGMAGKVLLKLPAYKEWPERTCETGILGSHVFCTRLLKEKETVIGKPGTVKFQNYTPKGKLRFPGLVAIRDYE